jgi:hypothetical protein
MLLSGACVVTQTLLSRTPHPCYPSLRYYVDFGPDKAARLRFLLPYLAQQQRGQLEQLLGRDPSAGGVKVEHRPYDWTLNSA